MRRASDPRARTTKPMASPSLASAATFRVRAIVVPALTVGAAVRETPLGVACGATETLHGAGPPPASATAIDEELVVFVLTSPNETDVGLKKTRGLSARARSIRPPPSRRTGTSAVDPAE